MIINGSQNYTGPTLIQGGTLQINSYQSLGQGSSLVFGGGVLQLNGVNDDLSNYFNISLQGSGTSNAIDTYNVNSITLGSSPITGPGGLTKWGTGNLVLSCANNYSGLTTIGHSVAGTVTILASTTSGGTTSGTFSMNTWLPAGTLTVSNPNALQYSTVNIPNGSGGSVTGWYYSNQTTNHGTLTNGGALPPGQGDFLVLDEGQGSSFAFGGLTGTNSFALQNTNLTNGTHSAIALTIGANNQSATYQGLLTDGQGGGSVLHKVGTGTQTLTTWVQAWGTGTANGFTSTITMPVYGTQTDNWTGGTIIDAGTLQIANYAASTSGRLPIAGTALYSSWSGTVRSTYSGSITGNVTDNGTLAFNLQTFDMAYAGNITGSGGLAKTGSATLTLSGTNNYTGTTLIGSYGGSSNIGGGTSTGGVLIANSTASLPGWNVPAEITVQSGATLGLAIGGTGWTDSQVATITGSATGATWMPGSLLGIGTTVADQTLAAPVGSNLGLNKFGSATLTMGSASTYTGATLISGGTLKLASGGPNTLPTGTKVTYLTSGTLGATLDLNGYDQTVGNLNGGIPTGSGTLTNVKIDGATFTFGLAAGTVNNATFAGSIYGAGNVVKQYGNTQWLTGTNTYTGSTTVAGGTLLTGTSRGPAWL